MDHMRTLTPRPHCITDKINVCVENTVPIRTVLSFSNKPLETPELKALLNMRKRLFWSRGAEEGAERSGKKN